MRLHKHLMGIVLLTNSMASMSHVTISEGANGNVVEEQYSKNNFVASSTHAPSALSLSSGKNVDLSKAIRLIQPDESYVFNLHPDIEDVVVSWDGGDGWKQVLQLMAMQNGLAVIIDDSSKMIGLARSYNDAQNLALPGTSSWVVSQNKSLRKNLQDWCIKSGWTLEWAVDIDYPISHAATFTGYFIGEGGVVHTLLKSFSDKKTPLTATFYHGNNVVVVHEAGYEANLK